MTDKSPNLMMPFLHESQAQAEITHNEALLILDITVQGRVIDRDLTAPPGSPAEGDAYIVAATATGDWVGKEDDIAYFFGGIWKFITPNEGWEIWVTDEALRVLFLSGSWEVGGAGSGLVVLSGRVSAAGGVVLTSSIIGATFSIAHPGTGEYDTTLTGIPAGEYYIEVIYHEPVTGGAQDLMFKPNISDKGGNTGRGTNTGFSFKSFYVLAAGASASDVDWSFRVMEL